MVDLGRLLLIHVPAVPDALPDTRHQVRKHLERFGVDSAGAVELALAEALENAVLHAYPATAPGAVEVMVVVDDDTVEVVVRDNGVGFEPEPQGDGGGYGAILMEALADRVEFDATPGVGTTVRMEFGRTVY